MTRLEPRVLLVDPDPINRARVARELCGGGYDVQPLDGGAECLLACGSDPPDVLILDVSLPDMDGFELCERVRRVTRDVDLIVIVMTQPDDDLTRAYLGPMVQFVGGDYFFSKPCDPRLLLTLLDDLLGRQRRPTLAPRNRFPTQVTWPTRRPPSVVATV